MKDKKDFHFRPFYNFRGLAEVSFSLFNLTGYFKEALKSDWLFYEAFSLAQKKL